MTFNTFAVHIHYKGGTVATMDGLLSFKKEANGYEWQHGGPQKCLWLNTDAIEAIYYTVNGFWKNLGFAIWRAFHR